MGEVNENFPSASGEVKKRDTELTKFEEDRRKLLKGFLAAGVTAGVGGVAEIANAFDKLASLGEADPNLLGVEMHSVGPNDFVVCEELAENGVFVIRTFDHRATLATWEMVMAAIGEEVGYNIANLNITSKSSIEDILQEIRKKGASEEEVNKIDTKLKTYLNETGKVKKLPSDFVNLMIKVRGKDGDDGNYFYWKNANLQKFGVGKFVIDDEEKYFIKVSGVSPKGNDLKFFVHIDYTNKGIASYMVCFQINDEIPPRLHSQSKGWGRGIENKMFEEISKQLKAAKIAESQKGEKPVAQRGGEVKLGKTIDR